MSNASFPIKLSARSLHVLAYIAGIAAEGGVTPTNNQIDDAIAIGGFGLGGADYKQRSDAVAYELERLAKAGRLRLIGRQRKRVFIITDTGLQTKVRAKPPKEPRSPPIWMQAPTTKDLRGWPAHGRAEAASYDRAVAARLFALHETPAKPQPFQRMPPPVALMSLMGCSAGAACA